MNLKSVWAYGTVGECVQCVCVYSIPKDIPKQWFQYVSNLPSSYQ